MAKTIGKKELAARVSARYHDGIPKCVVPTAVLVKLYDLFLDEIFQAVADGEHVSLNGFGSFFAAEHKGHPVQFGTSKNMISDYLVFKFSPSKCMNKRLRSAEKPLKD